MCPHKLLRMPPAAQRPNPAFPALRKTDQVIRWLRDAALAELVGHERREGTRDDCSDCTKLLDYGRRLLVSSLKELLPWA